MKKIIFILLLMILITSVSIAQGSTLSLSDEETTAPASQKKFSTGVLAQLKAEKDFLRSNKQAENIRWYEGTKGFFVYYTENGNKGKSFYNKKGNFVYNVLSYQEQFLPFKIKKWIKSVYYMDYRITHVNEIRQDGKTIFLVQITDDSVWKKIRIVDDEMEVIKEYDVK